MVDDCLQPSHFSPKTSYPPTSFIPPIPMKEAIYVGLKNGALEDIILEEDDEEEAKELANVFGVYALRISRSQFEMIRKAFGDGDGE